MRLLLDTHAVMWLALDRKRISRPVFAALAEAEAVFVSIISACEYGIKRSRAAAGFEAPFAMLIEGIPATPLGLDYEVSRYADSLPLIHRDPFDRMLIAQAMHHGLTLITADKAMRAYPVPTLW